MLDMDINNTKFEELEQYKQELVIDEINEILKEYECNAYLEKTDFESIEKFAYHYIKTDKDVLKHNICYFDIRCPVEFLNVEYIINNDNDYLDLAFNLHLYIYPILDMTDELIKKGILKRRC